MVAARERLSAARGPGACVYPLAVFAEETEDFDGGAVRRAEPVRYLAVELRGFARPHDEIVFGQPDPQPAVQT